MGDEQPDNQAGAIEPSGHHFKKQRVELSIAFLIACLQIGLPMVGIQENFGIGLFVWLAFTLIAIHLAWEWEPVVRHRYIHSILRRRWFGRALSAALIVAIMALLLRKPLLLVYRKDYPTVAVVVRPSKGTIQASSPATPLTQQQIEDTVRKALPTQSPPLSAAPRHPPASASEQVSKIAKQLDEQYKPPARELRRVDVHALVPSEQMCQGMSDEQRISCLCPRPVTYTMTPGPTPPDNNYSTMLTITTPREGMHKARVFLRSMMSDVNMISASPFGQGEAAIGTLHADYDKISFLVQSSAPERNFVVAVSTSESLRVICINQEN